MQYSSISSYRTNNIFDSLLRTELNYNNEKVRLDILCFFSDIKPIEFVDKEYRNCVKNKNLNDSIKYLTIRNLLSELYYIIINPQYGKCFLIKGSSGSGKTHFINQMLKSYDFLPIHFVLQNINISFSKNLIHTINELICQNFESFRDFITFFQRNEIKERILIVVENIEKINKKFYNELFLLIEESSSVKNIFWILSINHNYFDTATEYEFEFKKYSHHYTSNNKVDIELLINACWFDLNYTNKIEEIGKKIITKDLNIDNSLMEVNYFKGLDIDSLNLIDPFLAWIIYETSSFNKSNFIDIVLLEVVKKLDDYFRKRYDKNLSDFNSIIEFVDFTSNIILANQQIKFNRISLENEIAILASNISELQKSSVVKTTLQNLYNIGLFNRDFTLADNFYIILKNLE